jgi:hypothetical protein
VALYCYKGGLQNVQDGNAKLSLLIKWHPTGVKEKERLSIFH